MQLCSDVDCTGCTACFSVCKKGAIQLQEDFKGFIHPIIDTGRCVGCGMCSNACPILGTHQYIATKQSGFACWSKDSEIRKNSSSGGLFTELAKYILDNNGYVVGAALGEDLQVEHVIIDSSEDLYRLMGSKYVQSNTVGIYNKIATLLKSENRPMVLFSGTPCQIDALRHVLKKDYANLYTCDVVCHGVPSPGLWRNYIKWVEEKNNSKLVDYNFRWKKVSWTFFHSRKSFENGKTIYSDWFRDVWLRLFLSNKGLRSSCYNCRYANMNRPSDITLADFWGFQSQNKKDKKNDKGISLVICNTEQGNQIFERIKEKIVYFERDIPTIRRSQQSLSKPWGKPVGSDTFWKDYSMCTFDEFLKKHYFVAKPHDVGAYFAKYGMIKLGLFVRWNIIGKAKKIIKSLIKIQ